MDNLKSSLWRHGRRSISGVKDKGIRYGMAAWRGFAAIVLLLATGGWVAPVAVVAAPVAPTDGAAFDITWSSGCQTPPPAAVIAFDYAAGLWGTWISSTVPISVTACWTPLSGSVLGTGTPTDYIWEQDFSGAPSVNTYYPVALANALSGSDLKPGLADITLRFTSNVTWSFALTPTHLTAPADNEDFVAVALHELAHGLGFVGNMYADFNIGFCGDGYYGSLYPCPTSYDRHVVDSEGVALLDYHPAQLDVLGARLQSDANFGGPNTVAANGGTAAKLYTPGTWQVGSSLSHLDLTTYEYSLNRLMTPSYGGVTRHPGPVTLAMFQDMGWLRADGVPNVVSTGPRIVGTDQVITFTGDLVWSSYTGQPVTYTWAAADQITITHPGLTATDNVTFTWATPGEKRITLTATDGDASAAATRAALIYSVDVSGLAQGDTNHAYTFEANVMPEIMSFPITYTWEATDKAAIVHANVYAMNDSAAFTWTLPGTKTVTITAAIAGATTHAVHVIEIEGLVLDKFIFLPLILRQ